MTNNQIKIFITVIGVAAFLFISIFLGASSGRREAESEAVFMAAQEMKMALDFFYKDNDRLPTANEFGNEKVISQYLSGKPNTFKIKECPEPLNYTRADKKMATINFCLPDDFNVASKGQNTITIKY